MTYTIVISDLHGMYNLLVKALDKIEASNLDVSKIVFTGDYVDRGPDSAGVVALVRGLVSEGKAIALKGNHEDMMAEQSQWWLPNGGDKCIESYQETYLELWPTVLDENSKWVRDLPLYHLDDHRIYVHGYAPASVDDPHNFNPESVLWGRYDKNEDLGWYGKHVVHGHTPRKKPELLKNRTNLDTGAVFGGPLSVGVFDDTIPGGPIDVWEITGGA